MEQCSSGSEESLGNKLLLREGAKIVEALGRMFAPMCEVVLHDLTQPDNSILAIANPLSGRAVGEPTTEMGLARIRDPLFPDVVQNYANTLPDGRATKSTSIGLRNGEGTCIAAICLNMDLSLFDPVQRTLEKLIATESNATFVKETFRSRSLEEVRNAALAYAASRNVAPRALSVTQRHELVQQLASAGLLQLRGAPNALSQVLGVARSSIYNSINAAASQPS